LPIFAEHKRNHPFRKGTDPSPIPLDKLGIRYLSFRTEEVKSFFRKISANLYYKRRFFTESLAEVCILILLSVLRVSNVSLPPTTAVIHSEWSWPGLSFMSLSLSSPRGRLKRSFR
jgi:hypothetical protein